MKIKGIFVLLLAVLVGSAIPANAGQFDKTGQAGMTFLKIGPMARTAGMGDASTGISSSAASMFSNPAGLGHVDGKFEAVAGQVSWFAEISVMSAAVGVPVNIGGSKQFVVGLSFVTMDYGDIYGTVIDNNDRFGFQEVGKLDPSELALGITLAKEFTDKFSLGLTAKYVSQELPWYNTGGDVASPNTSEETASVSTIAFDAGTFYRTGIGSSVISMSIRNFSRTVSYVRDDFRLPLTFSVGVSTDLFDLMPELSDAGHRLTISADGLHPMDHPEKMAIGGEYSFSELVFLRGGYGINYDARKLSLGAGLKYSISGVGAGFDYAYSDFGDALGAVNYFTLTFGMK